jgi:hypothetical protein
MAGEAEGLVANRLDYGTMVLVHCGSARVP